MKTPNTTVVFCSTQFAGFHRWPDAPDEVGFLRDRHRHIFHVEVEVAVDHDDRDVEFILLKRDVERVIKTLRERNDTQTWSCEHWARSIGRLLQKGDGINRTYEPSRIEVSEDGENGARLRY